MYATALLSLLAASISLTAAAPTRRDSSDEYNNFYLVTTSSNQQVANSSLLPNVSATSLFDPYHQETYLLRLTGPGYGSLPQFNLSQSTLHTPAYPLVVSDGPEEYNSTVVQAGKELGFDPSPETAGNLGLFDGYLLTVDGSCEGWTICTAEIGEPVVSRVSFRRASLGTKNVR